MTVRRRRANGPLMAGVLLALSLLTACADAQPQAPPSPEPVSGEPGEHDADAYAAELLGLTNEARAAEGVERLDESACAQAAGLERADALVGQEALQHAPLAPVIADCAPLTTAAENLVTSSADPADVVEAWLASPGHRANIVDPALTEIGIGCVPDGDKLLCSQIFLGP